MKKQLSRISSVAAILGAGLLACAALTSPDLGVPVSDAVGSTLKGGACAGIEDVDCYSSHCDTNYRRKDPCNTAGKEVKGEKAHCTGHLSCEECYEDTKDCT